MTAAAPLILIPCHSLEDFPSDLGDAAASGLLNAFAVAFHPLLWLYSEGYPRWGRADDPPAVSEGQVVFIPTACDGWVQHDWAEQARRQGALVVQGQDARTEIMASLVSLLPPREEVAASDAADFLALGHAAIQVDVLSRKRPSTLELDTFRVQQSMLAAARCWAAGDVAGCREKLSAAAETLLEFRERFYPVDCYLIDLCLMPGDVTPESLARCVHRTTPWNAWVSGNDAATIVERCPAEALEWHRAIADGRCGLVGGDDQESPIGIVPLQTTCAHLVRGREQYQSHLGAEPAVWGRRQFGPAPFLPQLLQLNQFAMAMHFVLDDGVYPDEEHTRFRWQGCDGSKIPAMSRLPLAVESPGSYLKFASRFSESMDRDHVAGLGFARWPDSQSEFWDDLERVHALAPVFGKFVTLSQIAEQSDGPAAPEAYSAREYHSPYLWQMVVKKESNPLSRFIDQAHRCGENSTRSWLRAMTKALYSQPTPSSDPADFCWLVAPPVEEKTPALETTSGKPAPTATSSDAGRSMTGGLLDPADGALLARAIVHGGAPADGWLIVNPLGNARRIGLTGLEFPSAPPVQGPILAAQHDATSALMVEVPGHGFCWIPRDGGGAWPVVTAVPLADEAGVRNELLEVGFHRETGGIQEVRRFRTRTNRLSQQLAVRFAKPRRVRRPDGDDSTETTNYSEMRCTGTEVTSRGPAYGEWRSVGELIDPQDQAVVAKFVQTIRIWRGQPRLELHIELSDVAPLSTDPWNSYVCCRFAWHDSSAVVTRSVAHQAQPFSGERIETSDFIEIASGSERTTLVAEGLPFHRISGPRRLDTLLIAPGETRRKWNLTLAFDEPCPSVVAAESLTPCAVLSTKHGPSPSGPSGWLISVDSLNVRTISIEPSLPHSSDSPASTGFALRLLECEGQATEANVRCFRQPTSARKRNFQGLTLELCRINDDAVIVPLRPFELAEVELAFD